MTNTHVHGIHNNGVAAAEGGRHPAVVERAPEAPASMTMYMKDESTMVKNAREEVTTMHRGR